jgi:hypothetical protein
LGVQAAKNGVPSEKNLLSLFNSIFVHQSFVGKILLGSNPISNDVQPPFLLPL